VQTWVKQLTNSGLAPPTVRSCHNLLAGVLEAAVRDRLIGCNPARGVQLPATPPGREVYLTQAEVDQVAAAMADDADQSVLLTLAHCGLHWGELAGLRRSRLAPTCPRFESSRPSSRSAARSAESRTRKAGRCGPSRSRDRTRSRRRPLDSSSPHRE